MTKRFCDSCGNEIPKAERFYWVDLGVMKEQDRNVDKLDNRYGEFCYTCSKSGKALIFLFTDYEGAQKDATNPSSNRTS